MENRIMRITKCTKRTNPDIWEQELVLEVIVPIGFDLSTMTLDYKAELYKRLGNEFARELERIV